MDALEVLLMEEHQVFLYGLSQIVQKIPQISGVMIASDPLEAMRLINARKFAVYVLDADLAGRKNYELIRHLREKDSQARIIVHVRHDRMWRLNAFFALKVNAIISKRAEPEVFQQALLDVLQGKSFLCSRIHTFKHSSVKIRMQYDVPTEREMQILRCIAKGLSSAKIASLLHISENTVETHRKQLMSKFEAKNGIELTMKAVASGIIHPE